MRRRRITYRPNKSQSVFSGAVGIIFVLIGIFVAIPNFGILWTLIAVVITVMNFYQAFGKKYIGPEINIEEEGENAPSPRPDGYSSPEMDGSGAEKRLRQLQELLDGGLITREEYEKKREEIIRSL